MWRLQLASHTAAATATAGRAAALAPASIAAAAASAVAACAPAASGVRSHVRVWRGIVAPTHTHPCGSSVRRFSSWSNGTGDSGRGSGGPPPSPHPHLQPLPQQEQQQRWSSEPMLRERERETTAPAPENATAPSSSTVAVSEVSGAELAAHQDREMKRATQRQRRLNARARRSGTDWRSRASSRASRSSERVALPPPPPVFFPSPFASLPVIPSPRETLESALIRVDKVPKSPGFGKEVSRIRGQLAKYNFVARRQLEVAQREFADKLEERVKAFPPLRKRSNQTQDGGGDSLMRMHESTPSHDPFSAQLHPYDHNLVEYLLPGGAKKDYTTLLNHCRNLVQKLRGAAAKGLAGLNHSKNMSESRTAHVTAIRRMKELWVSGDPQGQMEVDGGSGQRSGMQLVEELRLLSRTLRHIPTIEFERNLLDVKRHAASYLSVLPQEFFFALPSQELTFERLRPYLPPSPTYTFSLVGAPNVGKSSLLAALSAAKVEVRDFAFTTRSVQVGHLQREELESPSFNTPEALAASATKRKPRKSPYPLPRYTPAVPLTRVQLVDTPGLLFRPDAMRKPVEKLTLSLCENIQPLLLAFVLDPTGQSGSGVRTQAMLLREMHRRFALHRAPHPLADDTDPRNHLAHDPLYANVAADAELQSLTRRLQAIPWMVLRSKADVGKREHVKDEVLARSTNAAEREVRAVEEELMQHNDAAIHEEEDNEAEAEEGEEEKQDVDASSVESSSTALEAASVEQQAKKAKMTRAEWKMASIRAHMHKYLCDSEGRLLFSSLDALVDEELPRPHSKVADMLQLTSSSDADALAITQRASHRQQQQQQQQQAQHGSAGSLSSLPCLRVSVESGQGISELVEHIWWEVDRRESLRLERAYKEMRKRILWIRGETEEGRASAHQQQQLSSSTPRDHLLQSSTQQQQHVHSDPVDAKLAPPSEF